MDSQNDFIAPLSNRGLIISQLLRSLTQEGNDIPEISLFLTPVTFVYTRSSHLFNTALTNGLDAQAVFYSLTNRTWAFLKSE